MEHDMCKAPEPAETSCRRVADGTSAMERS